MCEDILMFLDLADLLKETTAEQVFIKTTNRTIIIRPRQIKRMAYRNGEMIIQYDNKQKVVFKLREIKDIWMPKTKPV